MKRLFIGIKGYAVCINKKGGDIVWKTKLKTSADVTNIFHEDDCIFAYSSGHLFCLSASDGQILWKNGLSGFGYGPCIITGENSSIPQQSAAVAAHKAAADAAANFSSD